MKIEKMTLIGHSLGEQELRSLVSLKGTVLIAALLVDSRRIPEHGVRAEVPCEPFVAAFSGNSSLHPSPSLRLSTVACGPPHPPFTCRYPRLQ
jgi:hypothetical protein